MNLHNGCLHNCCGSFCTLGLGSQLLSVQPRAKPFGFVTRTRCLSSHRISLIAAICLPPRKSATPAPQICGPGLGFAPRGTSRIGLCASGCHGLAGFQGAGRCTFCSAELSSWVAQPADVRERRQGVACIDQLRGPPSKKHHVARWIYQQESCG